MKDFITVTARTYHHSFLLQQERMFEGTPILRGWIQGMEMTSALRLIQQANAALPSPRSIHPMSERLCFWIPIIIGVGQKGAMFLPNTLQKSVTIIHEYTGKVAALAMMVASVALVRLGQRLYGGLVFTFIATSFLADSKAIPHAVLEIITYLGHFSTLYCGSMTDRIFIVMNYGLRLQEKFQMEPFRQMRKLEGLPVDVTAQLKEAVPSSYVWNLTEAHLYFSVADQPSTLQQAILKDLWGIRKQMIDQKYPTSSASLGAIFGLGERDYALTMYGVENSRPPLERDKNCDASFKEEYSKKCIEYFEKLLDNADKKAELLEWAKGKGYTTEPADYRYLLYLFLVENRVLAQKVEEELPRQASPVGDEGLGVQTVTREPVVS
jgi:hypothetical protein